MDLRNTKHANIKRKCICPFFLFYFKKKFTWKKYLHNDLYLNGHLILLCMLCCCWVSLCHCIYKDSFSSLFLCLRIWRRCCLSPHTLGNSCTQLFMPARRSCCSAFSRPSSPTLCITGKRSLFVCCCCICLYRTMGKVTYLVCGNLFCTIKVNISASLEVCLIPHLVVWVVLEVRRYWSMIIPQHLPTCWWAK